MPKPRTKRQAIRDERKSKRREKALAGLKANKASKRQRLNEENHDGTGDQELGFDDGYEHSQPPMAGPPQSEREFFGMLSDQEQEYFRSVDEQLDIDDFPSQEERQLYLASVFTEAQGKELKLACSQSCSRLMERLILMSNTRQKKKLFLQFATHFLNLIQHRFASHCCETLFLQSAPIITRELGGEGDDILTDQDDPDEKPLPDMEELFLLTLDELEGHLGYLMTDRFASHTLRVLLIILSGRPLNQSQTKSLIHSKKKEQISVPWTSNGSIDSDTQLRAVPMSFNLAAKKIIADSVSGMNSTELRVLAKHTTGNPVLQLLLELDIGLNLKAGDESGDTILLGRLLPGAPGSLKDATTPASDFVNTMLYDHIGSRLLEVLITNCPGKIFKAMYKHVFESRIHSFLRNDVASYPAIRILNRLSKEDLVEVVEKTLPEFEKLVRLFRFNVIKTLFERCHARQAKKELGDLTAALVKAFGGQVVDLVPRLCSREPSESDDPQSSQKNQSASISHGSQLVTAMLAIPGPPSKAIQRSLMALEERRILEFAETSPTCFVLISALSTPSENKLLQKKLVGPIPPHAFHLALSRHGQRVLNEIISIPSKSPNEGGTFIPFHIKELIMNNLTEHEAELRESSEGRRVWRVWKGDLWKNRRREWISWAKQVDPKPDQTMVEQQTRGGSGFHHGHSNGARSTIRTDDQTKKRKWEEDNDQSRN